MAIYNVTASAGFRVMASPVPSFGVIYAQASATFGASAGLSFSAQRSYAATAAARFGVSSAPTFSAQRTYNLTASAAFGVSPRTTATVLRTVNVTAAARFGVSAEPSPGGAYGVVASASLGISAEAHSNLVRSATAQASFSLSASARSNKEVSATAEVDMGFAVPEPDPIELAVLTAGTGFQATATATAKVGGHDAEGRFGVTASARASVLTGNGTEIAGGDSNGGLRHVVYPSCSGEFPMSFAETSSGMVLIANGVDPMLRWDGLSGIAEPAGVIAPSGPTGFAGLDVGTITGLRYAAVRFIDGRGNPSALSPISQPVNFGRDAHIDDLTAEPGTGYVLVRSPAHGLADGEPIVIRGVVGPNLDGTWDVLVRTPDTFAIPAPAQGLDAWPGGGSWTWGCATVVYHQIPAPSEAKVVRRQLLRTLDGDASVFYVDIDTFDLTSTTLASSLGDDALAAREAVPIVTSDDVPFAARYGVPPNHKSIVASHLGRVFAAGDVTVTRGNVVPVLGLRLVRGVATRWTASLAGRFLYVDGATRPYEIESVDPDAQTLTLTGIYEDPTQPYAMYAIRPAPAERKLVYYSEPALPEAWPAWNAFAVPDDEDEIVGLSVADGLLWIVERRHIYRFTHQEDPSQGSCFLVASRGAINGRCMVQVEDVSYSLDETGIYVFGGGRCEPASTPIQSVFRPGTGETGLAVDWASDTTLWHAACDPTRDTIRWFVQMVGYGRIEHAICLDYRQQRWWVESYPFPVTASAVGTIGARRSLVGSSARRVLCLGEGSSDLVADDAAVGGSVLAADSASLTDASAPFDTNLEGVPVAIVSGPGAGQVRIISSNTADTLVPVRAWDVVPDSTSRYQVGGIPWTWRSGWFEYLAEQEDGNDRSVSLVYQPTQGEATADLRVYHDHADDPEGWGIAADQDGVKVVPGTSAIAFDLRRRASRAGWSIQRDSDHSEAFGYGPMFVSVSLGGVQGRDPIRIYQITINGARPGVDQ